MSRSPWRVPTLAESSRGKPLKWWAEQHMNELARADGPHALSPQDPYPSEHEMTAKTYPRLTPRQREALATVAHRAAQRPGRAIPHGAINAAHWDRFLALGLAQPSTTGPGWRLTDRGLEFGNYIATNASAGRPPQEGPKRSAGLAFRCDKAEKAAVEAYAARNGTTVSEVVREGLRGLGVLS